jgi:hypothetical protein
MPSWATENFQLPFMVGLEGFPKTYDMPPFCGHQKVLVAIEKGN